MGFTWSDFGSSEQRKRNVNPIPTDPAATSVNKALCFAQNISADFVKEIRQYMNHNHVIGYATLALKNLGYSQDEIWKVIHEMHSLFDFKSEEEAAEQAEDFLQERQ